MRWWWWALGALVLAGVVAGAVVLVVRPSSGETLEAKGFRLVYPDSWRLVPTAGHNRPLAVLAPRDGGGRVTITPDTPLRTLDGARLVKQVRADFSERLEDYRLLSAAVERTAAGTIFVYSFTPPNASAVHTVALVPAGDRSFLLTSVAAARADGVARQIDGIIRSFRPS
jgi:hypothetical protein